MTSRLNTGPIFGRPTHRINLCYRAPSYPANQRVWLTDRDFNHGFQTRYRSPETLAPTQRIRFAPKSGHRRPFYRWRGTARTSCLTVINRGCAFFPYTTFDNISQLRTMISNRQQYIPVTELIEHLNRHLRACKTY